LLLSEVFAKERSLEVVKNLVVFPVPNFTDPMTQISACMSATMSAEAQERWLWEQGCVVRGTFIDVGEEKEVLCHRRTRSLPASSRLAGADEPLVKNIRPTVLVTSPIKEKNPTVISLFDSIGDEANASTAAESECRSPRSESDTWCSESDFPNVSVDEQVHKLAQLITEECSYLNIEGHRFLVADDLEGFNGNMGLYKKSVSATLCVFVANLPWTKRAKWRHPLLRSAATALEGAVLDAAVVGGNLYVTLPGRLRIKVDFAAAR
jgi:hypothetical protein